MRRSERFAVELPITWVRSGRIIKAVGRDINLHGLFMCTDESIDPGSLMLLSIALPEHTINLFVTARFVGRTAVGHGIGVEIFAADGPAKSHWLSYYRTLAARSRAASPVEPVAPAADQ